MAEREKNVSDVVVGQYKKFNLMAVVLIFAEPVRNERGCPVWTSDAMNAQADSRSVARKRAARWGPSCSTTGLSASGAAGWVGVEGEVSPSGFFVLLVISGAPYSDSGFLM
jgi:hypothetical protein